MKQAAVLGAQTFLGFTLCKELLNRGIQVLAVYEKAKNRFEQRQMEEKWLTVGRNAYFELVSEEDSPDLGSCDTAICEASWLKSRPTPAVPFVLVEDGPAWRKDVFEKAAMVYTGHFYGPWQPATEELIQWAADEFKSPPFRDEPGLYIEDAAKTIIHIAMDESSFGKTFYLPGNGVRSDSLYSVVQKTALTKGLDELKNHIEQYPFFYHSSALV
ncbi:hypothetical protein CEF21_08625 [Bacillus sp. FJAT-42376]|uniref:hypothetical protein n=1 Tax=Bacillus sp. FJAT-42376 TaxID=2014076 RepID=UPI000F4F5D01|nr:hypothetical protein [Bacillus sp. FJAT-42376]AZB42349.1 hypothetical protein CEF21_08625 [Bacillus sp. FJAT-42376]